MSRIYDLSLLWWKLNESYSSKERLWVILSPQVKSLQNWMQGHLDGRISPNCKLGYTDGFTGGQIGRTFKKRKSGIQRPPIWSKFLKGGWRDPRTNDLVQIFKGMEGSTDRRISPNFKKGKAGINGPPFRSEFLKGRAGVHGPPIGRNF